MAGIAIDLPGAEAVLDKLREEVTGGLAPVVHQGRAGIGVRAQFGLGSPSPEVTAARAAYHDAATVCVANLFTHLSNAEHMIARLELALEGYRQADAQSAVSMPPQDVHDVDEDPTVSAGAFGSGMVSGFAVTFRPPPLPEPREYVTPYCLDWGAYNVPRDAVILQREGEDGVYQQVMAFRALSAGLGAHYRRLLMLRDELAMVWSPQVSEAAMQYQALLDQHIAAVVQDAAISSTNANLFYGIVDALADAKGKIDGYHQRWNEVTTDWTPEFWDHAAEELDGMARSQLIETDSTIRDWRSGILVGDSAKPFGPAAAPPDEPPGGGGNSTVSGHAYPVSPVPGKNPVTGPVLASAPQPVPASPANPLSMLPIPPGASPLAPTGGAWVLPGPGTGPVGRLMPMPQPTGPSGPGGPGGSSGPAGGSVGPRGPAGVRPPMAGPSGLMGGGPGSAGSAGVIGGGSHGSGKTGGGKVAPGAGREKWEVRRGVNPVIDGSEPVVPDRYVGGDDLNFDAWFARTATPWTA
ncbi:MAG TPA: hypothetical protein VFC19_15440 [Candidatus Limnocylindrales bacterium]|nr:hypothetical protein [Candidatus Limnocylindrales bacterium]